MRATAAAAPLTLAIVAAGFRPLRVVVLVGSGTHPVEFVVQFVAGVGEVLKQFHFLVKVNEKSLVCLLGALGVGGQHKVNKLAAGLALVFHGRGDAAAGIDEKANAERQVAFAGEALDDLGTAVLSERKVRRREVGDHVAFFVADGDGQQYLARLDFEGGDGLVVGLRDDYRRQGGECERKRKNNSIRHGFPGRHLRPFRRN